MKTTKVTLGLKENWKQFTLLVIVNAFVGGMIGLERTIIPQIAEADFGMAAKTAILSFIVVFGITKAITNYYTGTLANRFGRKNLLVTGWIFALPVPILLIYAPDWNWIIAANIFLGISQGLTWSSTVVMKIDLVGEKDRGFAMGLNEFAGYIALGCCCFLYRMDCEQLRLASLSILYWNRYGCNRFVHELAVCKGHTAIMYNSKQHQALFRN